MATMLLFKTHAIPPRTQRIFKGFFFAFLAAWRENNNKLEKPEEDLFFDPQLP